MGALSREAKFQQDKIYEVFYSVSPDVIMVWVVELGRNTYVHTFAYIRLMYVCICVCVCIYIYIVIVCMYIHVAS